MFHTYSIAYTQHLCIHIPVKQKIKPDKKKIIEASHNMIGYLCPAPKNWEPVVSMLDGWKERQYVKWKIITCTHTLNVMVNTLVF